jgi:hypothetical protein
MRFISGIKIYFQNENLNIQKYSKERNDRDEKSRKIND